MAVTIEQIEALRKKLKQLTAERDRAKGREETLMGILKKDFKCSTLSDAKKLLRRKKKELKQLEEEAERAFADFKIKHKDLLDDIPF